MDELKRAELVKHSGLIYRLRHEANHYSGLHNVIGLLREAADALSAPALSPERVSEKLFLDNDGKASLGMGSEFEELVINAGTKYITSVIGHYSTGDRRFTIRLYNTMLHEALQALREAGKC